MAQIELFAAEAAAVELARTRAAMIAARAAQAEPQNFKNIMRELGDEQ